MPSPHNSNSIAISDLLTLSTKPYTPPKDGTTYSAGDTHGNAIVLARYLFEAGLINLTETEYEALLSIYKQELSGSHTASRTNNTLKDFRKIIQDGFSRVQVPGSFKLRLFGDTLADRGANDAFTLIIFDEMNRHFLTTVDVTILLSNHDKCFLNNFFAGKLDGIQSISKTVKPCPSLERLQASIKTGAISADEINRMVHSAYLPRLRLLDYKKTKNGGIGIDIMTHAPFTLAAMENAMCKMLPTEEHCVIYESVENAVKVIESLNQAFSESLINKSGRIFQAFVTPTSDDIFYDFIWPRLNDIQTHVPLKRPGYLLGFRHGHDGEPGQTKFHGIPYISHNSDYGKGSPDQWKRITNVLCTQSIRSLAGVDEAIRDILNAEATSAGHTNSDIPEQFKEALLALKITALTQIESYLQKRGSFTETELGDRIWTGIAETFNATLGRFFTSVSVDVPYAAEARSLKQIILSMTAETLNEKLPLMIEALERVAPLEANNAYKRLISDLEKEVGNLARGTVLEKLAAPSSTGPAARC